jgi:hypothetical protein
MEFAAPKPSKKDDIVWHTSEESAEKQELPENIDEKVQGEEVKEEKTGMESYEIKIKNYDEEKKKKKEKKKLEEGEEKKQKEEKKFIDKFMLLDYMFSFIENEQELNSTLAGYFAKVFLSFFNKKLKEVSIFF